MMAGSHTLKTHMITELEDLSMAFLAFLNT